MIGWNGLDDLDWIGGLLSTSFGVARGRIYPIPYRTFSISHHLVVIGLLTIYIRWQLTYDVIDYNDGATWTGFLAPWPFFSWVGRLGALCTGEKGVGKSGKPLSYQGSKFHRVIKGYVYAYIYILVSFLLYRHRQPVVGRIILNHKSWEENE